MGALDSTYALTALGRHLAALPVDVRIGKLMLFGAIFCCVDSALTMAACLSHKSPFVAPFGKKAEADAKRREFSCANSDQLTTLRAYRVTYFYVYFLYLYCVRILLSSCISSYSMYVYFLYLYHMLFTAHRFPS